MSEDGTPSPPALEYAEAPPSSGSTSPLHGRNNEAGASLGPSGAMLTPVRIFIRTYSIQAMLAYLENYRHLLAEFS